MATRQGGTNRIPQRAADKLAEIECPVEQWVAASAYARNKCTLPPGVAAIRRTALAKARELGYTVLELAKAAGMTESRVRQLQRKTEASRVRQQLRSA